MAVFLFVCFSTGQLVSTIVKVHPKMKTLSSFMLFQSGMAFLWNNLWNKKENIMNNEKFHTTDLQ